MPFLLTQRSLGVLLDGLDRLFHVFSLTKLLGPLASPGAKDVSWTVNLRYCAI